MAATQIAPCPGANDVEGCKRREKTAGSEIVGVQSMDVPGGHPMSRSC